MVLIKNKQGDVLGSVGITGDTSDNDEACAVAGIEAAGLRAPTVRKVMSSLRTIALVILSYRFIKKQTH